jgi:hypothetical protein
MAWASSGLTTSTSPGLQAVLSLVESELTHAANNDYLVRMRLGVERRGASRF